MSEFSKNSSKNSTLQKEKKKNILFSIHDACYKEQVIIVFAPRKRIGAQTLPRRAAFLITANGNTPLCNIFFDRIPPRHQLKSLELSRQSSDETSDTADDFLPRLPLGPRFRVDPTADVALWITEDSTGPLSTNLAQSPERATIQMFSSNCRCKQEVHAENNTKYKCINMHIEMHTEHNIRP